MLRFLLRRPGYRKKVEVLNLPRGNAHSQKSMQAASDTWDAKTSRLPEEVAHLGICSASRPRDVPDLLTSMRCIHDLERPGNVLVGQVPDPFCTS